MATNTGKGWRSGAIRDRHQILNPATGLYTVFRSSTGKILRVKRSPGPAKNITIRRRPADRLGPR